MKSNRTFRYGIELLFITSLFLLNILVRQMLALPMETNSILVCVYAALACMVGSFILTAYSRWQWSNEPRRFVAKP